VNVDRKILIKSLIQEGYLSTPSIIKAMETIPRELFIPPKKKGYAYVDRPLEIGNGQTISAPHMVAIMAEALDFKVGHKVLEIGTGSGYHAAVISHIIGKGHIYTIERHSTLAERAKKNLTNANIHNVTVIQGDGSLGLPKYAPYHRIYVTCASPGIPAPLIDQLAHQGKLLIPQGRLYCRLILLEKNHEIHKKDLGGCVFVPLIGEKGYDK
jgi:protein-L-isoaspartate(D-aspartate) O-methyltransferase